jgi:predicted RNA-binding protein with RPS1 domain
MTTDNTETLNAETIQSLEVPTTEGAPEQPIVEATISTLEAVSDAPAVDAAAPSEVVAEMAEVAVAEAEVAADAVLDHEVTAVAETDAVAEAEAAPSSDAAAVPATLADVKPKQQFTGKVKKVELFGAFVDLGNGVDGLLHVSQVESDKEFRNVADILKPGDEVTVWVRKIDAEMGRVDLTMRPMLALGWGEVRDGMTVTGKVVKIERFGVFVEIGAERPGMIHVSELASGYVNAPEDVVKIGDEITAKVIKVNRKKKQIDLSRKALEEPVVMPTDDDDTEPAMTPMELALRNAMRGTEMGDAYAAQKVKRDNKRKDEKHRKEQEDLLNRTLKNRVK